MDRAPRRPPRVVAVSGRGAAIRASTWLQLGGVGVLVAVLLRLDVGPAVDAVTGVPWWALAAGAAITFGTTVCCAWRWRLVATRLGVAVSFRTALAACYRSQLLNSTVPTGVVGDVHRALRYGRQAGDLGGVSRSVVGERLAGQAVQVTVVAALVLVVPDPGLAPLRPVVGVLTVALAAMLVVMVLVSRVPRCRSFLAHRHPRVAVRRGRDRGAARVWIGVVGASVGAGVGHTAMFVIAARVAGSGAPVARLAVLGSVVLVASALPLNVAGWGPREGAAAWAFGSSGLGAAQGLATAVVFGVVATAAVLPGLAVLVAERRHGAHGVARVPVVTSQEVARG
jgi:uncharacterized membrane protein YbhN (UPF0104 family)